METEPVFKFTELHKSQPKLTSSELLNSNNKTEFSGKADVVVAGAGILGLCYAIQLKNNNPDLKIEIFEKSPEPVQKIGESTLSPFSKFTTGAIVPQDYLLRIFGLKDGLQFYCIDENDARVTCSDVGGLDVSFQLDRRMSELFLTMWAQSLGINVYHGVDISFEVNGGLFDEEPTEQNPEPTTTTNDKGEEVPYKAPRAILKDSSDKIGDSVDAKLVCDASGFSRRLTSKFGGKERFEGWNCDAYWSYFKEKPEKNIDSRLINWDFPATKHMCFPEGWGWYITLISWHHSKLGNLMDLVNHVITNAHNGLDAENLSPTRDLAGMFNCPYEFITSIGWAIRNDTKWPENLSQYGSGEAEQKFMYIQKKYPTLNRLMEDNYQLLPNYYGDRTFFVRKALAYRSPVAAGEGWLAIGNCAGFTNPLISPGINAGICGAFRAAMLSERILNAPKEEARSVMKKSAHEHQHFMHDHFLHRLHQMNRLWYNSFRDHRLFETIPACFWTTAIEEVEDQYGLVEFTEKDSRWALGNGNDELQEFSDKVLAILEPEDGSAVGEAEIEKAAEYGRSWLAQRSAMHPENKWGRYLYEFNDKLEKTEGKTDRDEGKRHWALKCEQCRYWVHNEAAHCPICATEHEEATGPPQKAKEDNEAENAPVQPQSLQHEVVVQ